MEPGEARSPDVKQWVVLHSEASQSVTLEGGKKHWEPDAASHHNDANSVGHFLGFEGVNEAAVN